jgi:hypothetical protein
MAAKNSSTMDVLNREICKGKLANNELSIDPDMVDETKTAYRTQADALDIEAQAKRRLADEYDAAQERGEVAGHGGARNFNVPDQNVEPSAKDIGLSRKDIHEARIIRDAAQERGEVATQKDGDRHSKAERLKPTAGALTINVYSEILPRPAPQRGRIAKTVERARELGLLDEEEA